LKSNLDRVMRVRIPVPTHRFSRREAVALGAGATALAVFRHPVTALAARPAAFEMALSEPGGASAAAAWRTLPVTRAPRRFHLLGLRWDAGSLREVQVRARTRRGEWGEWVALGLHDDHAPDHQRRRRGSDPAWTGAADLFQFRVRGSASGLRARFVQTPARVARARASAAPRSRASQAGAPPIILRPVWGGNSRPPKSPPDFGDVQLAFVHHTVSTNDYLPEDSASIVLGICQYHQDHNKWNDIGYNFVVDKYGQIFEGRAGGIDQAVIGAQAQGYNSHSTGIACIGDFSTLPNADAGLEAVAKLIAWKLPLHGAPVTGTVTVTSAGGQANRYPSGTPVTLQRISGHRDGDSTACPGEALYGQLQRIRDRAAQLATPVSSLSGKVATAKLRHPAPLTMSGVIRFSDAASPAGAPIRIQHQAMGAAWTEIASAAAAADGTWTTSFRAPGTGSYRAVFPGDAAHPPLEAAAVAVTVIPRVAMKISTRRAAPSTKVNVTGNVGPSWPTKVALVLEIKRGGAWRPVQRKRINVRGGGFSSFVRPKAPGLYRISIEAPGSVARRQLRVTTS
jgi:hypothetical protein